MIPVLHLRAGAALAGPERWLLEAAEPFAAEGFAPTAALLTRQRGGAPGPRRMLAEAAAHGLAAVEVADPERHGGSAVSAVAELARRGGAALLHAHDSKANWIALRVARRLRRPAVATVHLHTRATFVLRLYARLDRALLARFAAVLAVSDEIAAELAARVPERRLHRVPNGLDAERLSRRAEAERGAAAAELAALGAGPWIVGVGRLARQKGFDLLLAAVAGGGAELAAARVALLGDGPQREALARRARELGLGGRVALLGERSEVAGFLAAAGLVALPSRREGLPYAALEALALGRPLVATAAGGLTELVGDDRRGWRVAVDDVTALRAALADALARPEEAARRAELGRRLVLAEHGARAMGARVAAVYREVLAGAGRA